MYADLIVKGKIYTADENGSFASAMAVRGGKILAVGSAEELECFVGGNTRIIERSGLIIPGVTEGHAHISCSSELVFGVALGHETDAAEYLKKIKSYADANPDEEVIIGSGYDNGVFEAGGPSAALLDSVCAEKPVVMIASDHHSRWVNTKALELMGLNYSGAAADVPGVIRDSSGKPTGWLQEPAAMGLTKQLVEPLTAEKYAQAIAWYQDIALENGVTIAFEPIFDSSHDYDVRARAYKVLEDAGKLRLTVRLGYTLDPSGDIEADYALMLKTRAELESCMQVKLTTAKFFVDGVVECHTALLREAYADTPGDCGKALTSQADMDKYVLRAMRDGFDVHTHVIGDAASDIALNAYERAQNIVAQERGSRDFRNAMTHVQLLWQDQIERMAENGIVAVVNPYWHVFNPVYYEQLELPYLGQERASREYPVKSILDKGVRVSQASDFPVTVPPRTMDSLHTMVNRTEPGNGKYPPLNAAESISVREAIDVLTRGGAYQLRLEHSKGSLEKGKDADFVVLTDDVFSMPAEELYRCNVAETWIAGEKVWSME